jgi:signal transduction histidine kinase
MVRRYVLSVGRAFVLGGLAIAGLFDLVIVFLAFCCLCVGLVFFLGPAIERARPRIATARRLAAQWCEVDIPTYYWLKPTDPEREADGWYRDGNSLYKRSWWVGVQRRMNWMFEDQATARDVYWLLWNPLVSPFLALSSLFSGPPALRLHGRWTLYALTPKKPGVKPQRWLNRHFEALWHQLALFGLSVAGFVFLAPQLLVLVWVWQIFPPTVVAARQVTNEFRRVSTEWIGVRIDRPYLPSPPFPVPRADGLYQRGRRLYDQPWGPGRLDRMKWVWQDKATRRDAAAAVLNPFVSGLLALPVVALVGFGFIALQCLWIWRPLGGSTQTDWADFTWFAPFGFAHITTNVQALVATPLALAFFLAPIVVSPWLARVQARFGRLLLGPTEASRLAQRVQRVERTRTAATDAQATELRRIERDLHDGVQSRLVAMGMKLAAVEALIDNDPAEAKKLVRGLRESSSTALTELRDLVRGIHPPVLSERGLADAVRAVALDSPLKVEVTIEPLERLERPAEACVYFVVCELLGNSVKHGEAKYASVDLRYDGSVLRMVVTDDGSGGASPVRGTGLRGIERRIGAFDGRLRLESPAGGPTKVTVELTCQPDPEPSSPRTSTSSETA